MREWHLREGLPGEGGRRVGRSSAGRAEHATVVSLRGRTSSPDTTSVGRSLKTAAEVLAALRLLGANPDGVTAEMLATELGKSPSTARYLLNTLTQEGYAAKVGAVHLLAGSPPWGETWGEPARPGRYELPERRSVAVTDLHARTRRRTYLARWEDDLSAVDDENDDDHPTDDGHTARLADQDLPEREPADPPVGDGVGPPRR